MKASHYIEYVLFLAVGALVRSMPLKSAHRLGEGLGALVFALGYRREVTLRNLTNAFPEISRRERLSIAREAFRTIGGSMIEFMWSPNLDAQTVREYIRIENPELLTSCARRNKGAVLLTAHFGNWELMAQAIVAYSGLPVHIIVKPQANKLVDETINRWRRKLGNKTIEMGMSLREVLKALHEGACIGIAGDQTAPKESVAVNFFGRDVPTYEGPAALSLKTGAPLIVGFPVFSPEGYYRAHLKEISTEGLTGSFQDQVAQLTQRHISVTEHAIREHPGQWMWMHKRWKHVPDRKEALDL